MRKQLAFDDCEHLYRALRDGNENVFYDLHDRAVQIIHRRLRRMRGDLPPWLTEDISETAFSLTGLRLASLPRWSAALSFAWTIARRLAAHTRPLHISLDVIAIDPVDRMSQYPMELVDLEDSLSDIVKKLDVEDLEQFMSLVKGVLVDAEDCPKLAGKLGICIRTLRSHRKVLRIRLQRMWR